MKYFVLVACVFGSSLARPDGAGHGHGHGHHDHGGHSAAAAAAPAPTGSYQEPSSGYAADPGSGYDAPTGYAAPSGGEYQAAAAATGYDTTGYSSAVSSGYGGGSGYAVQEDTGFNPSMLIIPILIIAGIALLFPSVTTVPVSTSRRKRSAEDEVSGNSLVDRVQDIYTAVIQSEECMERVACEIGGIVADAGLSKDIFSAASAFVPNKYSKMMKQFSNAKNCHKIKCGAMF